MPHDVGLAFLVEHEAILITTSEAAETHLTIVNYTVTDLVETSRDAGGNVVSDVQSLIDLLASTVQPTTWSEVGGLGTVEAQETGDNRVLAIPQTQDVTGRSPPCSAGCVRRNNRPPPARRTMPPLSVPPPGAAQVKIEAALNSPADMEFKDAHLTDVIDTLKDRYKIEIQFDRKAMDEAGIGSDATVTRVVKGTTLRRALRPMLHDLGLACVVEDEVLLVTTTEAAETKLNTVLYPVADLVTRRDEPGNPETDFDSLFNVIHSTVEPTTWDEVGGPGHHRHQPKILRCEQTCPGWQWH